MEIKWNDQPDPYHHLEILLKWPLDVFLEIKIILAPWCQMCLTKSHIYNLIKHLIIMVISLMTKLGKTYGDKSVSESQVINLRNRCNELSKEAGLQLDT